jgi:MFS family permease
VAAGDGASVGAAAPNGLILIADNVRSRRNQVPIGRLSDSFDRRIVLAALGLGVAGTSLALVLLPHSLPVVLPAAALLGGFMSTIYRSASPSRTTRSRATGSWR